MKGSINTLRNNLDKSLSPYLKQHADNPIHWQEWSAEILEEAKKQQKNIFVSIGYSTCHWCHVMASEAFSDLNIAKYLNENFISVKVDREQRPDIDRYFMSYINSTRGEGGWPLNVFLSPKGDPIVAFTYMPVERKLGMPPIIEILKAIKNDGKGILFKVPEVINRSYNITLNRIVNTLLDSHDDINGGFGNDSKFPPHSTMLFLLSYYERYKTSKIRAILECTLDNMKDRGLHDHLQGGFFRYCVDRKWTIPHFEKMLYDQSMMLWVYSWAYAILKENKYIIVIDGILKCLDETFFDNGLYISAYDADTEHQEGKTYLWSLDELTSILETEELSYITNTFTITKEGNFEGTNHLVRKVPGERGIPEDKLLQIRKKRVQPFADRKIITSWNALTAIGLIMAWRATGNVSLLNKAIDVFEKLIQKHFNETSITHSSLNGISQTGEFLEDAAALLLLATYIHEEKEDKKNLIDLLKKIVLNFKEEKWIENKTKDFFKVTASDFDHSLPSSVSLAKMALFRASILMNEGIQHIKYKDPFSNDFHNLLAFIAEGHWHFVHTSEKLSWNTLSTNSIQILSSEFSDCFEGKCSIAKN